MPPNAGDPEQLAAYAKAGPPERGLPAWDIRTKKRELMEQMLTGAISSERWMMLTKQLDDQLP